MFRKAKVTVTVYRCPVHAVTFKDTTASNLHFGEMTEVHARRERRRHRHQMNSRSDIRSHRG